MTQHSTQAPPEGTCPWCGASGRTARGTCVACTRYYVPARWELPRRRTVYWPWWLAGVGLFLAWCAYLSAPFLPDPVTLLFRRPSTQLSVTTAPQQWPMSGLDLQQRRAIAEATPVLHGRHVWSLEMGRPTRSAPVVVDEVLYIGGHFRVLALDARTGRRLWEQPVPGPVDTALAVAGDLLYLGLTDWRVVALERLTGQTRWAFAMQNPVAGAAAVADGIVYIGSMDGFLYALDAATGGLLWQFQTEDQPLSPPALAEGALFLSATDGKLYALHPKTGQLRLRFRTPERLQDAPVVSKGLVYFPSGGQLYAVAAHAREYPGQHQLNLVWAQLWIWQFPVPRPPGQPGSTWRFTPRPHPRGIVASPAVTPEGLYVGDVSGHLYARDAARGEALWQFQAGGAILTSPVVVGATVYFGAEDGHLYALDRAQGTLHWRLALGSPLQVAPVWASQRLYLRTKDGRVHTLE